MFQENPLTLATRWEHVNFLGGYHLSQFITYSQLNMNAITLIRHCSIPFSGIAVFQSSLFQQDFQRKAIKSAGWRKANKKLR
jgi:hypothetical protein